MMLLSKDKLKRLESLWQDYPDGLNLSVFVQIILDSIECQVDQKYELLHGALKLFSEIDINGDQSMEWEEFMQYVIDAAQASGAPESDKKSDKEENSVLKVMQQEKAN